MDFTELSDSHGWRTASPCKTTHGALFKIGICQCILVLSIVGTGPCAPLSAQEIDIPVPSNNREDARWLAKQQINFLFNLMVYKKQIAFAAVCVTLLFLFPAELLRAAQRGGRFLKSIRTKVQSKPSRRCCNDS